MNIKILFFIMCTLALSSCQEEKVSSDAQQELRTLSFEEEELIRTSNTFAFDLIRELSSQSGENVFLSPYYINMALSMALNGAEDKTLDQMQDVLQYSSLERLEVNKVFNELTPFFNKLDNNMQFVSAHALWHHQDVSVRPLFRDMMVAYYGAGVESLDFFDYRSALKINKWVAEQTKGKLEPNVPVLTQPHAMYVVSAAHIKGRWTYPFAKESTAPGTFYFSNNRESIIPMMYADQTLYRYHQDEEKTLVDIPYGNQQYSMTITMPHQADSLGFILNNINNKSLSEDLATADTLNQPLYLPKFSINSQLPLRSVLSRMGMKDAFSATANFSGIFSDSLQRPMAELIHQAGIQIDEAGSQTQTPRAAAAINSTTDPVVRINRPFAFFIRENHSGAILYTGLYRQPANQ